MRRTPLLLLLGLVACADPSGVTLPPGPDPSPTPAPVDTAWDLYILAGQSNMVGRGKTAEYNAPDLGGRVYAYQDGAWVPESEPLKHYAGEAGGVGPAGAFAAGMLGKTTRKIGLIPCASSATAIVEWQRDNTPGSRYEYCMRLARRAAPAGRFRGVLFFQGEWDGVPSVSPIARPQEWGNLFSAFVSAIRADLNEDSLPVVFAQIGTMPAAQKKNAAAWAEVQRQQAAVQLPGVSMIVTSDVPTDGSFHYPTASYVEIGKRFAAAASP